MKNTEIASIESFELLVPGERAIDITSVYCADLLSWAMSRAPEGSAWCTVMGNVNAVAVAQLADVALLVLCEGAALDDDAAVKAAQQGIAIARTTLPAFKAGLVIAKNAGLYGLA